MDSRAFDESSLDSKNSEIVDGEFEEIGPAAEQVQSNTRLAIVPQASLAQSDNRIWCAYCFRTLDPNDHDDTMHAAVRVGDIAYHLTCWNLLDQPSEQPVDFLPLPPEPLSVVTLVGAPLYTGPINTLNDKPLGISGSLLVLDSPLPLIFTIRNNSTQPIHFDRRIMPAWAFVRYPSGGHANGHLFTLFPAQTASISVHPHLIRPDLVDAPLMLTEMQSIMLESRSYPVISIANLVGLYAIFLWHLSAVFDLSRNYFFITRYSASGGGLLIAPIFTCFLLVTVLVLLAPGRVFWSIQSILYRLNQTPMERWFSKPETIVLRILESESIVQAQTRLHTLQALIIIGITAAGTAVSWLALLLISSVIINFSGLFFLAEVSALLFVIYHFGKEYGFDLVKVGESIIRKILHLAQSLGVTRL